MFTPRSTPETILCSALFAAKDTLSLTNDEFGAILHVNHASVDTLQAQGIVKIASEQGDIAKSVIRIEQALRVMVGNDPHTAQHWIHCHNHHVDGIPVELMSQAEGLARVLAYLQMVNRSS